MLPPFSSESALGMVEQARTSEGQQICLRDPLILKCLLELSWQISARGVVSANTRKRTDCVAELWFCTFFAMAPELRKIAPE